MDNATRLRRDDEHYAFLAYHFRRALLWVLGGILLLAVHHYNSQGYTCSPVLHTVTAGDTLDGIARQYCDGRVTDAVDYLVDENGGATIYIGQVIALPSDE
ncbi:MAG: LysM peptidoglycan-binding domain-containing protein [Bacteroidota bacterium]